MPLALRDLQAAFAAHLLAGDRADLVAAVIGDSIRPDARLRIHRHHVFDSLGNALASTFPTVQSLVGEAFFRALARRFVANAPPVQPVLAEYGSAFADFIERQALPAGLPHLADIARLDWALNLAFHSPDEPRLTAAALAVVPAEELPSRTMRLAPGAVLVRSAYPIDLVWRAAQPGAPADTTVELTAGPARLLVLRQPDDAAFIALAEGEAAFVAALADQASLERAAEAAFAADPAFDVSAAFARLLAAQVFAAMQHEDS